MDADAIADADAARARWQRALIDVPPRPRRRPRGPGRPPPRPGAVGSRGGRPAPEGRQDEGPVPPPSGEYRELTRRVRAAGLLARQPRHYLGQLLAVGALLALGLLLVARFRAPWQLALAALYLAVVAVQLAFLVHDAGNRQAFAHRW